MAQVSRALNQSDVEAQSVRHPVRATRTTSATAGSATNQTLPPWENFHSPHPITSDTSNQTNDAR